jgi:N-acetyl-gamma-glutamyl-phosphate reductase
MKVAVIGAAGYAGGELLRLLLQHPDVAESVATSRSQAGKPIGDAHPALAPVSDARFSGATPGEASRGRDVVFLCLEHGESSRVAGEVFDAGISPCTSATTAPTARPISCRGSATAWPT